MDDSYHWKTMDHEQVMARREKDRLRKRKQRELKNMNENKITKKYVTGLSKEEARKRRLEKERVRKREARQKAKKSKEALTLLQKQTLLPSTTLKQVMMKEDKRKKPQEILKPKYQHCRRCILQDKKMEFVQKDWTEEEKLGLDSWAHAKLENPEEKCCGNELKVTICFKQTK